MLTYSWILNEEQRQNVLSLALGVVHAEDVPRFSRGLLVPLVHNPNRRHYKGYCDEDYSEILLASQTGRRPSVRGACEQRPGATAEPNRTSPCKSQTYERILDGKDETWIRKVGTEIAVLQVVAFAQMTKQFQVELLPDETDEVSTSNSIYGNKSKAITESGSRVGPTKQCRKIRDRFKDAKAPFDAFRDANMLGHEYAHQMVRFPSSDRMTVSIYPTKDHDPQGHISDLLNVRAMLGDYGVRVTLATADARWGTKETIKRLEEAGFPNYVIRTAERGEATYNRASRAARKRQREKEEGTLARTPLEHGHRLWPGAKEHSFRPNVLVNALEVEPFQNFGHRCTLAVVYTPSRGYKFKPGEKLVLGKNMFPIFLLTRFPPTPEGAELAAEKLFARWDEEEDVKEHKSYRIKGSGPEMEMRGLHAQLAMIQENQAMCLWHYSVRSDLRTLEFLRYVYNKILELITTAKENGWPRPQAAPEDPPPIVI